MQLLAKYNSMILATLRLFLTNTTRITKYTVSPTVNHRYRDDFVQLSGFSETIRKVLVLQLTYLT